MKKTVSILFLGIAVAVVAGISPLKWKNTTLDLGLVAINETAELSFEFTNTTGKSIQILEAKGSCGCTNVQYPKEEIKPGESASVTANFRSGRAGTFKKNIRIKTSESEAYTYLYFTGEVGE